MYAQNGDREQERKWKAFRVWRSVCVWGRTVHSLCESSIIKEREADRLLFKDLLTTWKVTRYLKYYQWNSKEVYSVFPFLLNQLLDFSYLYRLLNDFFIIWSCCKAVNTDSNIFSHLIMCTFQISLLNWLNSHAASKTYIHAWTVSLLLFPHYIIPPVLYAQRTHPIHHHGVSMVTGPH